jgi:hypothetical protein
MTFLCQHPGGCLSWTEGNTDYCATHNAEERKRIRDESRQKEKERKAKLTAEAMQKRAAEKAKAKEPKKQAPIKARSSKRASEETKYRKRVKEWLQLPENETCKVCGSEQSTECHHKKGREGNRLLDERYWLPVCRSCHSFITEDSAEAIRQGYSLPRNH